MQSVPTLLICRTYDGLHAGNQIWNCVQITEAFMQILNNNLLVSSGCIYKRQTILNSTTQFALRTYQGIKILRGIITQDIKISWPFY